MKLAFCAACGSTEDLQHHHLVIRSEGGQACQKRVPAVAGVRACRRKGEAAGLTTALFVAVGCAAGALVAGGAHAPHHIDAPRLAAGQAWNPMASQINTSRLETTSLCDLNRRNF